MLDLQSCTNVRIYGLTLAESGGDGIYLGTATGSVPSKDIVIKDVVCDKNYRQGISVINAENLLIEDCVLSNTAGTAPAAGIDFEPNAPGERLVNCTLRRVVSQNNAGGGFLLAIPSLTTASAADFAVLPTVPVGRRSARSRAGSYGQLAEKSRSRFHRI